MPAQAYSLPQEELKSVDGLATRILGDFDRLGYGYKMARHLTDPRIQEDEIDYENALREVDFSGEELASKIMSEISQSVPEGLNVKLSIGHISANATISTQERKYTLDLIDPFYFEVTEPRPRFYGAFGSWVGKKQVKKRVPRTNVRENPLSSYF